MTIQSPNRNWMNQTFNRIYLLFIVEWSCRPSVKSWNFMTYKKLFLYIVTYAARSDKWFKFKTRISLTAFFGIGFLPAFYLLLFAIKRVNWCWSVTKIRAKTAHWWLYIANSLLIVVYRPFNLIKIMQQCCVPFISKKKLISNGT